MSYGLEFTNNSNVVTLDSALARMCVIASGNLNNNGSADRNSTNMFPRAVTTQEPPLVFVRPTNPNNGWAASLYSFMPIGSPGNWTGFGIVSTYVQAPNFAAGEWFACQFGAQAVASYGLRLWDGASSVLFDSGTSTATFTRSAQNWAYTKTDQTPTTAYRNYYTIPFNFTTGEFQMVNQYGMRLTAGDNIGRGISSWWDWPTNTLWAVTESFSNPFAFKLSALFAKRQI